MIKHLQSFITILALCLLIYFSRYFLISVFDDEIIEVDEWLEQNDFGEYKKMFRDYGKWNTCI